MRTNDNSKQYRKVIVNNRLHSINTVDVVRRLVPDLRRHAGRNVIDLPATWSEYIQWVRQP